MKVNEMQFVNVLTIDQIHTMYDKVDTMVNIEFKSKDLTLDTYYKNVKFLKYLNIILKRITDIIAGIIGTIILIPLCIVIWILNKIYKEDGPLFFIQERIGKNGKPFKMIKFRTMCVDADQKLDEFLNENPDIKEEFLIYRKIKHDPRVTKLGRILRKTSLDEWPQFLSLLTGNMSLVRTKTVSVGNDLINSCKALIYQRFFYADFYKNSNHQSLVESETRRWLME